jgi:hypothetical protein
VRVCVCVWCVCLVCACKDMLIGVISLSLSFTYTHTHTQGIFVCLEGSEQSKACVGACKTWVTEGVSHVTSAWIEGLLYSSCS